MRVRPAAALIAAGIVALSGVGNAAGAPFSSQPRSKEPRAVNVWATYYGWYDNTPPGCATAFSGCARGKGTHANPITFASDKHEFGVGTVLYYPTVEKYLVMGDDCQECDEDWAGKGPDGGPRFHHLDIWIGGKGGNEFAAINCEDALTQSSPKGAPLSTPFIENPPRNLPVSKEPLFNIRTGHCFGGVRTSSSRGRYRNARAGKCLSDAHDSRKPGSRAILARCGHRKSQRLKFEGAFFVVNGLCLNTEGGEAGSRLNWTTCAGGPREQWSVNADGTITWIQLTRCISDVAGFVELQKCSRAAADKWTFTA